MYGIILSLPHTSSREHIYFHLRWPNDVPFRLPLSGLSSVQTAHTAIAVPRVFHAQRIPHADLAAETC